MKQSADSALSRRELFRVLPCAAACSGCLEAQQPAAPSPAQTWTDPSNMSWQDVFRFAYQKDYIPLMKGLADRIGNDKFIEMIKETNDAVVARKAAGRPARKLDFPRLVAGFKNMPLMMRTALTAEILEETPRTFDYKVTRCLWAKTFRDSDAADLGYALICHPDFAVARSISADLALTRTKTLMQGADCCNFHYSVAGV